MQISTLVLTAYAAPGLGKSSLLFTADNPLCLDFDHGAHRAQNRKDVAPCESWADVAKLTAEDLMPYSTVGIDTGGRAIEKLKLAVIAENPKNGNSAGNLSPMGWGRLSQRFGDFLALVKSAGKDVVIICHMDEKQQGDDTLERIDAQGASKNEIYKSSDAMCRIVIQQDGSRILDFDPRAGGFGKNPAQLPKIAYPHPFKKADTLAEVIRTIKDSINKMTSEQAEAVKQTEQWADDIAKAVTLDQFNKLLPAAKEAGKGIISMIAIAAKYRKYKANKETGLYEEVA